MFWKTLLKISRKTNLLKIIARWEMIFRIFLNFKISKLYEYVFGHSFYTFPVIIMSFSPGNTKIIFCRRQTQICNKMKNDVFENFSQKSVFGHHFQNVWPKFVVLCKNFTKDFTNTKFTQNYSKMRNGF